MKKEETISKISFPNSNKISPLPPRYLPAEIEKKIYSWWEKNSYFKPEENSKKSSFCTLMPPPNVTGSLHMGHALDHSIQDCLTRWKRMQGFNCLWLPGTDHAGIATQSVAEKALAKEGKNRREMGQKDFLSFVWKWKDKYEKRIIEQSRRFGSSCDWSQSVFTLDAEASKAVRKAFVQLYKKSWIYRDEALIHWSPKLSSALSDLEVEYKETKAELFFIKYILEEDLLSKQQNKKHLVVATTRPETLFGDSAVAVHPEDERFRSWIGKTLRLPLTNRQIPVIADEAVQKDFGSGALKITPAHDFNDFKIGKKHQLKRINILNQNGTLNEQTGSYKGLSSLAARKRLVEDLKNQNLLLKVLSHKHSVGHCSRTGCVIEPLLSKQWFVRVQSMAQEARHVVENGKISFEPKMRTKTFLHWMDKIQDWCISRQLWWGHRLPVWYCTSCEHIHVSEEEKEFISCEKCGEQKMQKETDVLDTWFSSALWPLTTMGWPEDTETQKTFYPTDVLVTGHDIIFFWVARMIMMGLEFKKQVPFKTVYFHGLVRDSKGRKMSKSLGNTVDPLEIVESHGADSLRFSLLSQMNPDRDLKVSLKKLDEAKNFINKIWNSARFCLEVFKDFDASSHFQSLFSVPESEEKKEETKVKEPFSLLFFTPPNFSSVDQWILCKMKTCETKIEKALKKLDFFYATQILRDFAWYEFCDWYLEFIKPTLYGTKDKKRKSSQLILIQVFHRLLRLLHPFIPFITEEIYQKMPLKGESCMKESYPSLDKDKQWLSKASEAKREEIDFVKAVISSIRNIRGENRISPGKPLPLCLIPHNVQSKSTLEEHRVLIQNLANTSSYEVGEKKSLAYCAFSPVIQKEDKVLSVHVVIPLKGLVDFEEEVRRMTKNIEKLKKESQKIQSKISKPSFLKKAPLDILKDSQSKLEVLHKRMEGLEETLSRYKGQR